ncbi:hypothetical protein ACOZ38_04145 [Sphaerisporangium viridialbum]|uniref:hypothetical protein n=1 Tax=Sphaerisporangium viridialbum TaxID=46189 RepID=UPI003C79164E
MYTAVTQAQVAPLQMRTDPGWPAGTGRSSLLGRWATLFCVRLDSDLLDWRRDYDRLSYTVIEPPPGLAEGCLAYVGALGLRFGAFDFALTGDGVPVFLECNPNGQWAWLEDATGLPIAAAIADLLLEEPT